MLLTYLKLSLRLLARNPFFTVINVLGLSVGFASFFVLWNYATSELKTDQYHQNYERIVRLGLVLDEVNYGKTLHVVCSWSDPQTMYRISSDFPEVEDYVRILYPPDFGQLLDHGKRLALSVEKSDGSKMTFHEDKAVYADHNLFEFFSIPILYGENNLLRDPNTIVLSRSVALKYFGKRNAIGELLILNGSTTLKVTGVFQDLPKNTHLDFDFVMSNASRIDQWNTHSFPCLQSFVLLEKGTDFRDFEKRIKQQSQKYLEGLFTAIPNAQADLFVQPLEEVAFSDNLRGDYFISKSKPILITFSMVAMVILLMAWVNYVNLALARTSRRMKEIATRKAAGARSKDFAKQFLVESLVINLIALALSFTLLQLVRSPAEILLHLPVPDLSSISIPTQLFFISVVLAGIVMTGMYPAMLAMKYSPRKLSLRKSTKGKSDMLPGLLTMFQYTSATVLLLWVFVMYLQLSFLFTKGFGGGNDSIAVIEGPVIKSANFAQQMEFLQNRLSALNLVQDATTAESVDLDGWINLKKSVTTSEFVGLVSNGGVTENFIPFFGITLLAGRNFQPHDRENVVILSQAAAQRFGFADPQDAIGAKVIVLSYDSSPEVEVIGVIEDYRTKPYFSFRGDSQYAEGGQQGVCLTYKNYLYQEATPNFLAIKLDANNRAAIIPKIEKVFKEVFPGDPFILYFQDDHVEGKYQQEKVSRNQLVVFALMAIGIACLGLSGLISNKVTEKTKEIGVRKVLGAQLHQIAGVLLNSTIKQVGIATFFGIPVAYYLANLYLDRFSQRIQLHWWYFVLPVLIMALIMFGSIASALWRAANNNPVEALKYE